MIAQNPHIKKLVKTYFNQPENQMILKKGEVLMKRGEENKRLYYITSGKLVGYLYNDEGKRFEIFQAHEQMFAGVYSFFSKTYSSYATIIAEEDSQLAFISIDQKVIGEENSLAEQFMPILVNEISARQELAHDVALEKEQALKKLLYTDKMATLGQMAAGLAHELNNAIGVIQNKTAWVSEMLAHYMKEKDQHDLFYFFEKGVQNGQSLSSSEIRKNRKELESKFKLPTNVAKNFARIGMSEEEVAQFKGSDEKLLERLQMYWEVGTACYDILLAARHSVHVVRSVKQLGVASQDRLPNTNLHETIGESLALLKSELRKVTLEYEPTTLPAITANSGELVQVWVNLIKNAIESMVNANTPQPTLRILSEVGKEKIRIYIVDNGPGIPPEIMSKIFQPSFTTKANGLSFGLGLGLPTVQRLIESYEGKIKVSSRGGETQFTVVLPNPDSPKSSLTSTQYENETA